MQRIHKPRDDEIKPTIASLWEKIRVQCDTRGAGQGLKLV